MSIGSSLYSSLIEPRESRPLEEQKDEEEEEDGKATTAMIASRRNVIYGSLGYFYHAL